MISNLNIMTFKNKISLDKILYNLMFEIYTLVAYIIISIIKTKKLCFKKIKS
jgi:hypothetical protein